MKRRRFIASTALAGVASVGLAMNTSPKQAKFLLHHVFFLAKKSQCYSRQSTTNWRTQNLSGYSDGETNSRGTFGLDRKTRSSRYLLGCLRTSFFWRWKRAKNVSRSPNSSRLRQKVFASLAKSCGLWRYWCVKYQLPFS